MKPKIVLACENLIMCYDLTISFKDFDVIRVKNLTELEIQLKNDSSKFIFISITRSKLADEIFSNDSIVSLINNSSAKKIGFTTYHKNELDVYCKVPFYKIFSLPFVISEVNQYLNKEISNLSGKEKIVVAK